MCGTENKNIMNDIDIQYNIDQAQRETLIASAMMNHARILGIDNLTKADMSCVYDHLIDAMNSVRDIMISFDEKSMQTWRGDADLAEPNF